MCLMINVHIYKFKTISLKRILKQRVSQKHVLEILSAFISIPIILKEYESLNNVQMIIT